MTTFMMRRCLILIGLVPLFVIGLRSPASWAADPSRPNVVLFLVDDMGWMDSSPYGSQYYQTPNMARFASQSMRFSDAYAMPLCSPTRASILSGQYSSRHGVTSATGHLPPQAGGFEYLPATAPPNQALRMPISRNYLDPKQYTLAEALRDSGYRTGHFGKWHLGLTEPYWPEQQGFDVAFHCEPSAGPPGAYFSPYGVVPPGTPRSNVSGGKYVAGTITDGPDGEYITDRLTDEAIQFIEANRDQPFFLNLWHYGVHGPWGHKAQYTADFAQTSDPTGRQGNPIMASMLRSIDESLGRVMQKLDELGLADNTLFIFYSDNGGNTHSNIPDSAKTAKAESSPMMKDWRRWAGDQPPTNNAPLREGKGRIYEGGQRVPLMVRWPSRVKPGTTTDAIVGPIDLYPTILDAVAVKPSEQQVIDGESFLPVLEQSGKLKRQAYFTWFPHLIPAVSVRSGPWKLIRRFQPHPQYPETRELYHLIDDLGETKNLAKDLPDRVAELDAMIDQFVEQTGALYPQPNPNYRPNVSASQNSMEGLVPRECEVKLIDGVLRIEGTTPRTFLGTAQVRLNGPLTMKLQTRSEKGGTGKVQWRLAQQEDFPTDGQQVEFTVPGGGQWSEVDVTLPIEGRPGIVRIYLPAFDSVVELKSIEFTNSEGAAKRWRFGDPR